VSFHEETVRKLDLLYKYDCLRANKSSAAWGVEIRVPFLDREFLDVAMSFNPQEKMVGPGRMEKYPLRKAFEGYVPDEILWRQKEQFSDGVGYGGLIHESKCRKGDYGHSNEERWFPIPIQYPGYQGRRISTEKSSSRTSRGMPLRLACQEALASRCSTPTAIAWDESFARNSRSLRSGRTWRPSGRQSK